VVETVSISAYKGTAVLVIKYYNLEGNDVIKVVQLGKLRDNMAEPLGALSYDATGVAARYNL